MALLAQVFAEALIGNALGIASDSIIETESMNADVDSLLGEVAEKLQTLQPLVEEMKQLESNERSKGMEIFAELRMEKGKELLRLCSELPSWKASERAHFAPKLEDMNRILESLIPLCHMVKESQETYNMIRNLVKSFVGDGDSTGMVCNQISSTTTEAEDDQVQESVGQAALREALELLSKAVEEAKERAVELNPTLENVKDILAYLKSKMRQITLFNMIPTETETTGFASDLNRGAEVVRNFSDQLLHLDETLNEVLETLKHVCVPLDVHPVSIGNMPQLPQVTVGLDEPLEDLKKELLHENGASILLVTAGGGCGKTLLAQKFCQDDQVKDKFNSNIFFVRVSKMPPSLFHIVQELYEHKGHEVPPLQDEIDARNHLEQLLNGLSPSPILMVLDDVWPGSESLVEKFIFEIPEYKILMTSRFELPMPASPYHLKPLKDEDAMTLFCHWACQRDWSPPDDILTRMVDSYKSMPLALTIVAASLRMQPLEIWLKLLEECPEGSSSSQLNPRSELLASLLSNLNYSKNLVKECLMDLGSFPEDQRIPAAALIDMWTELYGIKEEFTAIAYLLELTAQNLANLRLTRKDMNEVDDYYSQHFITQHDLLREIAIENSSQESISHRKRLVLTLSGDELPEWWERRKEQPVSASLVSISTDEKFSSNWFNVPLPSAEVLVLNFQTKEYALPNFMENMEKLKALIVTNYSLIPAKLSNFQMLGSLTNLKRIRLERISISSLRNISQPLKNLQKISLYMCGIGEAFSNCSIEISDLMPNLREMNVDFCKDLVRLPVGVCDTIHLQKLSITHCNKLSELPNEIGNLVSLEVLRLRSCIELTRLPDSIRYLSKLTNLDLSDCISIKDLPEHIGDLHNLINVNLNQCCLLEELPDSFWDLEQSMDLVCDEDKKEIWETLGLCPPNITMRSVKEDINLQWLPELW